MGADLCAVYDLIFRADCDWNSFGRDIDILDLWGKKAGFSYSLIFLIFPLNRLCREHDRSCRIGLFYAYICYNWDNMNMKILESF